MFCKVAGEHRQHSFVGNHISADDSVVVAHPIDGVANRFRDARPEHLHYIRGKAELMFCFALARIDKRHRLNKRDRFYFSEISAFLNPLIDFPHRFKTTWELPGTIGKFEPQF
jgi:hypothetical protein